MMTIASADQVAMILDWAAAEGWNPGLDDAAAFYAADPQGFFLAWVDGQPVAAISVVNHDPNFAFLGLYICRPEMRGKGYGFELWKQALAHAGSRVVGLDGVADQQDNYRKSGFASAGSTFRFQGPLAALSGDSRAREATAQDLPDLLAMDQAQTGIVRESFLKAWFTPSATRTTLVLERDGQITGYGTIRQCRDGYKIGPLAAWNLTDARALLAGLAGRGDPAETVMIDVPEERRDLAEILRGKGFTVGFQTARMYRGAAPASGIAPYSAVATLELG